jgi:DNA-binding response OmpR family regulator
MKILLVEDDPDISQVLVTTLTNHRYTVDVAADGKTGLELATLWTYDLLLLDIELPNLDGLSICRQIRQLGDKTPILMLTVRDGSMDMIQGLDSGADDYMTKPCEPSQLLARIRALLRRGGASTCLPTLTWGNLCLDPTSAQVTYQGETIPLRPKEYSLLELFLRHPHQVFNRSAILDHLWTAEDFPTENAVTNLIKDLRQRLKSAGIAEDFIETIYGMGYRLKTAPIAATADASPITELGPLSESEGESIADPESMLLLEAIAAPSPTTTVANSPVPVPLVLLINSDDPLFAEGLQHEAIVWGLYVEKVPSTSLEYDRLRKSNLAAILLDLQQSVPGQSDGFLLLQELKQHLPGVPILTLADQNTLINRIQASRLGSDLYLSKPIAPAQVLELAMRLIPPATAPQATVMIVDDDPAILISLSHLLEPWGMKTIGLSNPNDFWIVLSECTNS